MVRTADPKFKKLSESQRFEANLLLREHFVIRAGTGPRGGKDAVGEFAQGWDDDTIAKTLGVVGMANPAKAVSDLRLKVHGRLYVAPAPPKPAKPMSPEALHLASLEARVHRMEAFLAPLGYTLTDPAPAPPADAGEQMF